MTLHDYINTLSKEAQLKLAIRLAKLALPIWDNYAKKNKLAYHESVVGVKHTLIKDLLQETIETIESSSILQNTDIPVENEDKLLLLYRQFSDPVIALQDNDWQLPDEVIQTFYAVYNLIDTIIDSRQIKFSGTSFYVSINQAINALETSETLTFDEINKLLEE